MSVIAADTVTADALATIIGVEGMSGPTVAALLTEHKAAALEVTAEGAVQLSPRWRDRVDFALLTDG